MGIIEKDLNHIWHPCMQMKDFELIPPLIVHSAKGSILHTNNGPVIDAQSSWWCKSLGHHHPKVIQAINQQMQKFDHIISANCTHALMAEFGEKIADITGLQHVFFASDGSCAVEIALKIAMQAEQMTKEKPRTTIINLANAYHGETLATLAVSDVSMYKKCFDKINLDVHTITEIPYYDTTINFTDVEINQHWQLVKSELEQIKHYAFALILEPLLQGAGGMKIYDKRFLKNLCQWAQHNNICIIADEIMTGIGRIGSWLAFDNIDIKPNMICLSKGLTSGTIPMSCVAIDHNLYELFYDDYHTEKAFLHSHTYSGHALGIAAALATIESIESDKVFENVKFIGQKMRCAMIEIARDTNHLENVRQIGAMVAADLVDLPIERAGFLFYQLALQNGALMRPLGNTIYWLPPLNSTASAIEQLAFITLKTIKTMN